MFHFAGLLGLVGLTGAAVADDGLDALLDSIPEISVPEPEEETEAAPPPPEEQDAFPTYVEEVRLAIVASWNPKKKIIDKNPRASFQLMIKISAAGEVTELIAVEPSGNDKFDRSVMEAIQAAQPFFAPPSTLATQVAMGLVLTISASDA